MSEKRAKISKRTVQKAGKEITYNFVKEIQNASLKKRIRFAFMLLFKKFKV